MTPMTVKERLHLKLLALASGQLGQAQANALCGEPDRRLVLAMVQEVRATLEEFEEGYATLIEEDRVKAVAAQPVAA